MLSQPSPRALALRVHASALLLLLGISGCHHAAAGGEEEKPGAGVHVRVQPAAERVLAEKVAGLGRCEAVPGKFAMLTVAAEGRVVGLLKRPGDAVQAGDPIVQLDTTVAQNNLVEKQRAAESQKLAIDQAELALKKAQLTTQRLKLLRQRNEISESAMYETEVAERQADLQLQSAHAQYKIAEAAVATAKSQLAQLAIRTPIAGILNSLNCHLGQMLTVGTSLGDVVDAGHVQAVVWLAAADAQRVKPKQSASVRACGSSTGDSDEGGGLTGKVLDIGKVADAQTGNVPVHIEVDNAAGKLTLGEAVTANVKLREEKSLAVPAAAVRDASDEAVLNVIRDGKSAVLHPKLGLKDSGWVAVSGMDLKPGEPVVVEGGYNLPEGTAVETETVGRTSESVHQSGTDSEVHPTESEK